MGFIIHFYIIFGTNLLTGGPAQIVVFAYFSVSQKRNIKQSPNGMKPSGEFFWNKHDPEDLEWTSRKKQGCHEAGRRACPLGTPPPSWAPCSSTDLLISPIYTLIPWKHPGEPQNHFSTAATFCTREIPSGDLFRWSAGGGLDHGGLLHQHHSLSDDVWVVYHRPSGP